MQDTALDILIWTIVGSLATIFVFIIFISYILNLYNRKTIEFSTQLQLRNLEKERELLKTRIDVQEETIQKISKELHDNVIQLLTLAKLNLNKLGNHHDSNMGVTKELLANAIGELSNISRSLSSEAIIDLGLLKTLEYEKDRVFQASGVNINIFADFNQSKLNPEEQLILYRITQESIRNAITHGKATLIEIRIENVNSPLQYEINDNGCGFDMALIQLKESNKHQGLRNIIKRALLLGATCNIDSVIGKGTKITIQKKLET